ncbi:hypothetical protein SMICM17S_06819 [Streptomyces microflavus]
MAGASPKVSRARAREAAAPGPGRAQRLVDAVRPEELGRRPGGGLVAQKPRLRVQAQQGAQDGGGVLVVDAPGVPLVVRLGRRLPHEQGEFVVGQDSETFGALLGQEAGGQVLAPVDGRRLRGERCSQYGRVASKAGSVTGAR